MKTFCLGLIFISGLAFADSRTQIMQEYSIQKLQQVASYLMLRVQSSETELLKCDPSPTDAQNWLSGPLHSLIDDKVPAETKLYQKNPKAFLEKIKSCHLLCSCNAYGDAVAAAEKNMAKHPLHKKITRTLDEETRAENPVNCAEKTKWFCGSSLEKFLVKN